MTVPSPGEPLPQRRAVYGRANQASVHYRPIRKGRPLGDPAPAPTPTPRAAKVANRRRFVLFVVALLVAVAFGTAIFGVVLANPAPMALAPKVPTHLTPEPPTQPLPPTGRATRHKKAKPVPPPTTTTTPRGATTTSPASGSGGEALSSPTLTYQNCNKAERAGALPLRSGEPGYSVKLDKDRNGIACDERPKERAAR